MTSIAVVGHVEWVDFLTVTGLPAHGQITTAGRLRRNAAGGAVVAAATLVDLGAEVRFFGAVGDDELGRRAEAELAGRGIHVHLVRRPAPAATREVITFLDAGRERSIVVIGERLAPRGEDPLPWDRLADADGVYVTAGDAVALAHARRARVLTASPRIAETLPDPGVDIDALIWSADDAAEVTWAATLAPRTRLSVVSEGTAGGRWEPGAGRWSSVPPPGPVLDSYGAGDSFAAGFTFGLARTGDPARAARIGATCGARAVTRPGGP